MGHLFNEFGYNEHPVTKNRFLYIKIIDSSAEKSLLSSFPVVTDLAMLSIKAFVGRRKSISKKSYLQWELNLGLWEFFVTLSCLPDWANLALFVRLKIIRSLHSHALLISAKSPKFKSQSVHKQRLS